MFARFIPVCWLLFFLALAPLFAQGTATIAPGAATAAPPGNCYALLIGINAYQHVPKLEYAVHDVSELREVLVNLYGFPAGNITMLTDGNASLENIRRALAEMVNNRRVKPDDQLLIYFSGHGQTVPTNFGGDMGFLIPADADVDLNDLANPSPYLASCLPMDNIWTMLNLCPARHVLLIADACYSGLLAHPRALTIASPLAAAPDELRALRVRTARQVMTAGGKGELANEEPVLGHGIFTAKLLEELKARATKPGDVFTTVQLYAAIKTPVITSTDGKQTPQLDDYNTEGEFLFTVPGTAPPEIPTLTPAPTPTPPTTPTTGSLEITSDPPGAKVAISGVMQPGVTPLTVTGVAARAGDRARDVATGRLCGCGTNGDHHCRGDAGAAGEVDAVAGLAAREERAVRGVGVSG